MVGEYARHRWRGGYRSNQLYLGIIDIARATKLAQGKCKGNDQCWSGIRGLGGYVPRVSIGYEKPDTACNPKPETRFLFIPCRVCAHALLRQLPERNVFSSTFTLLKPGCWRHLLSAGTVGYEWLEIVGGLLIQRECSSMLSGVLVNARRGVGVTCNAESGSRFVLQRVCLLLVKFLFLCFVKHFTLWLGNLRLGLEIWGCGLESEIGVHFLVFTYHVEQCSTKLRWRCRKRHREHRLGETRFGTHHRRAWRCTTAN